MKTSFKIILSLLFFGLTQVVFTQTSKWYLQAGGGYLFLNQIEQLGFDPKNPAALVYVEAGKTFQPLSIGVQQTLFQHYGFYRYAIKQNLQTIYAKYSLNQLLDIIPYGVDPYIMGGASYVTNRFLSYEENDQGQFTLATREVSKKPTYTIGAGIQVGSRALILGLHYQYSAGIDSFTLADFETLPFVTGTHLLSVNIGIRFVTADSKRGSRCPRFGGKGMLRF